MQLELVCERWHVAVVDARTGIGVAMASAMLCECASCLDLWWRDRTALDNELRVAGMAVVSVIPADDQTCALFLVGRCEPSWTASGDLFALWGQDDLPCAPGGEALELHPGLPRLWAELAELVDQLDGETA